MKHDVLSQPNVNVTVIITKNCWTSSSFS